MVGKSASDDVPWRPSDGLPRISEGAGSPYMWRAVAGHVTPSPVILCAGGAGKGLQRCFKPGRGAGRKKMKLLSHAGSLGMDRTANRAFTTFIFGGYKVVLERAP